MFLGKRVIVVMPAYNAERTLVNTYKEIPREWVDDIVLTDDASQDATVELARKLGLHVLVHDQNRGYGANQKTCYLEALRRGADIVVMVHPDHQYDARALPKIVEPIARGECEAVFGSRMLGGRFLEGGMPLWKFYGNVVLTALTNIAVKKYLTETHSGLRAYSRHYLESVGFEFNSNDFVFDTEIILQGVWHGLRIYEVPIETRYYDDSSQIQILPSIQYAVKIFYSLMRYKLHVIGLWRYTILRRPFHENRIRTSRPSTGFSGASEVVFPDSASEDS